MSKAVIGVVGGVVAAAAAVVGGAAWSGQLAQHRLEEEVAKLQTALPLKVVESHYEKSLFSATQIVVFKGGCEEGGEEQTKGLTLRQHIQHGPLPGFSRIGWAVIDTELEMPEELRASLKDAPPVLVSAHTELGLTGGFQTRVTTPAFEFKENPEHPGQARVQGLVFTSQGSLSGRGVVTYDLSWPGLSASLQSETADTQVQVGTFTMRGDLVRDDTAPLWFSAGKMQSTWDRFEVISTPRQPGGTAMKVMFSDIQGSGESTLDNGLLSRTSRLQGQGQVNDVKLAKINLVASLKRLHVPTYAKLMQQAGAPVLCRSHEQDPAQAEASLALMGALLPHNPEVSLDKFEMEIDGQPGEISYALGTQGVTEEEAAGPELRTVLFAKAYASGQARVPVAWLERLMVDNQPGRQAQDNKAMLEAMLGQAVDSGYVVRDGQVLNSQFKLDKGQLLVNGKALGPLAQ